MFCSSASLFNCFFTRWKKFSIGLMSGLLGETENIRTPISNIAFFTFEEFWLGSRPCRNNFSRGLLLFSKAFSKCFLTKPAKNCPVNCSSYCSHKSAPWPWAMGYKHFHHFTPRALFFSLYSAFQWQALWLFTPGHCSSWSGLVTWISFMSPWGCIKTETNAISLKVSKKQSCSGIMPWHQTFLSWFVNNANCYVLGYVWLYCLVHEDLPQIQVLIS